MKAGDAETFVSLIQNHVIVVVSKFRAKLSKIKNGAAAKSLALALVCGKRLVGALVLDQVGVRVETAAVAKSCISASRVRESAMTTGKTLFEISDLTFPVNQ